METKSRCGSERLQPGSGSYLANERACHGGFPSHPKGMALPAPRYVKSLDRGPNGPLFALFLACHPTGTMSRLSLDPGLDTPQ